MPSDIVVSIRYNDIYKIRQSKIAPDYNRKEEYITEKIRDVLRDIEKEIEVGLSPNYFTTEVVEIEDDKQKAMDIGSDILRLIDVRAQEKVDEIGLCRG